MFSQVWQYQKMRQHQKHFHTSGSSPPGSREGSLYKGKGINVFGVQFEDIRLFIGTRFDFNCLFAWFLGNMKEAFNVR